MADYEKKVEENRKRNEKYVKEFEEWLNEKRVGKENSKKAFK